MELSLVGTYLYMLMVVTLFTSPVTIAVLITAAIRGFLLKAVYGVLIALPLMALALQVTISVQDELEARNYETLDQRLETLFPGSTRNRLFTGRVTGYREQGGYIYTRYQFDIPELPGGSLELVVPPPDVTSGVMMSMEESKPGDGEVQLIIMNKGASYGMRGMTPATFLDEFFPEAAPALMTDNLLVMSLYARQSQLTYYTPDHSYPWRSQSTFIKWDTLPE